MEELNESTRIYTFNPMEISLEATNAITAVLLSKRNDIPEDQPNFRDILRIGIEVAEETKKYSKKVINFNIIKKFHKYCDNLNISSNEERQKLLDDTLYYYISNDKYSEKKLEIAYLVEVLGANINKKNEETNLSPYEYANEYYWPKNSIIKRDLQKLNSNLEESRELLNKPREFYNKNLLSYISSLIQEEQNRTQNILTPLTEINSKEDFEEGAGACKFCNIC